jgi:hypothetical protein
LLANECIGVFGNNNQRKDDPPPPPPPLASGQTGHLGRGRSILERDREDFS